ncbi:thioredoxin family protein [Algoriphagus sp. NG3]|uniref:thioredoxin family protein n=1 Tax=Algoriphagus sp. NG3 TaxID=3097546 RepID=UPI002A7FE6FF|nr:thioredoxin family protein [Algoriphagus sp. NG3]WPR76740.1 thioredoxin family protein [Algoriphagus sp. NG3]
MRKIALPLLFLCISLATYPSKAFGQQKEIDWISFEELDTRLDQDPKKVLIYFYTDWCTYCRKMEKEVFTNPEIVDLINNQYLAVKFDAESKENVVFDGTTFRNTGPDNALNKSLHELAVLLALNHGQFTPPVIIILESDFSLNARYLEYLHSEKLKKILAY